jgi:hypothetical protein
LHEPRDILPGGDIPRGIGDPFADAQGRIPNKGESLNSALDPCLIGKDDDLCVHTGKPTKQYSGGSQKQSLSHKPKIAKYPKGWKTKKTFLFPANGRHKLDSY